MQIRDADAKLRSHEAIGRIVQVDGERIFCREEGNSKGTPVLLLHGVPTSSFLWRKLMPLIGRHRTLAPDLPGLGLSSKKPDRDYSWTGLAKTIGGLVDALRLPPFHLVVHDIGGPIGLEFAIRQPGRVKSITLLNSPLAVAHFRPPFPMSLFRGGLGSLAFDMMQPRLMLFFFRQIGIARRHGVDLDDMRVYRALLTRDGGKESFLKMMRGFELTPEKERFFDEGLRHLAAENVPALVIWGEQDPATPAFHRQFFVERIPYAEVHLLPARHFLQEDHAEEIANLARPFWERVDGETTVEAVGGSVGMDRVRGRPAMRGWRKMAVPGQSGE